MKVAYLASLVGRRSFVAFFGMGLLLMSLLATLQVSSKQALRAYAEDQLRRVPWDLTLYQRDDHDQAAEVRQHLQKKDTIKEAETLFFLRTIVPRTTLVYVDGQPLRTPWLSLLTATSPDLVPPDIRPRTAGATLVLIGSKAQMGDAFLGLQNSRRIELRVEKNHRSATAMASNVDRVVRVEASELNRWFMDQTSSPTLVPELGLVIVLPYTAERVKTFDSLSRGVQLAAHDHDHGDDHDHDNATEHGEEAKRPLTAADEIHSDPGVYFPDVLHVVWLHAEKIVSGWHLRDSLVRTKAAGDDLRTHAQEVSYRFGMDNNVVALLERMAKTADAIGLISLLAGIPLLWVAWIVLGQLTALVLLNERRLLGLLRLRGAPGALLARSLAASIGIGAAAGCAFGALAGTFVPLRVFSGRWMGWGETWEIQDPRR